MRNMLSVMIAAALVTSGCASSKTNPFKPDLSAELPETDLEERALIGNLAAAYSMACPPPPALDKIGGKKSKKDKEAEKSGSGLHGKAAGQPGDADTQELCTLKPVNGADMAALQARTDYVDAGFALSDYLCEKWFRHVNKYARQRQYYKDSAGVVGTVVGSILSLSHAGAIATGVNTAATGAIDHQFKNFESAFLVTPDLASMRRLVLAAQDHLRAETIVTKPRSMFVAESTILRYAGLCSFLGMKDLLDTSVREKTAKIDTANVKNGNSDSKPADPEKRAKSKKTAATPSRSSTDTETLDRAPLAPPAPPAG